MATAKFGVNVRNYILRITTSSLLGLRLSIDCEFFIRKFFWRLTLMLLFI